MEKWRIYLILAGIILVAYNVENIEFADMSNCISAIIGVIASLLFVIMPILYRKK